MASIALFVMVDWVLERVTFYRLTWHPSLARFGLFVSLR
ncbi:MAG: hypothetical protein JWL84_4374 [Rhodospirillales bacterium]|nr:hypothetical protein [Rhodospirillales bacterium]